MNPQHWRNHLGDLAGKQREASNNRARILRALRLVTDAIADLVDAKAHCDPHEFNHAFAHLTDAKDHIGNLLRQPHA